MKTVLSLGLAFLLAGCLVDVDVDDDHVVRGSGDLQTVDRTFPSFEAVSFATEGTLTVGWGDEETLRIEADDNLLRHIETYVRNGTLHIEVKEGVDIEPRRDMRMHLTTHELDAISLLGSGDIEISSLDGPHFSVAIVGSGDVRIGYLETGALTAAIAGSGDLHVSGVTDELEVSVTGSGSIFGRDLETTNAAVAILGSGSATFRVENRLAVSILGSGSVYYYGHPSVQSSVLGSGAVIRKDS